MSEHDVTDEQPEEQQGEEQASEEQASEEQASEEQASEEQASEEQASEDPADEQPAEEDRPEERRRGGGERRGGPGGGGRGGADRIIPLRKLVELAARYPEVGPPLAELAFAIGEPDVGNQLVRLGTDREAPNIEYWFVAANAARRDKRYDEVIAIITQAVRSVASRGELEAGEEERLLHLVRMGFATLMFDLHQLSAEAEFVQAMAALLPALDPKLGHIPFYRTLMAQTLWFTDREASEREWDRADELGDAESTWNARGTWYHEAEKDLDKAERAYRKGLDKAGGQSALLLHNTAQILVEKAKRPGIQPNEAHRYLNQAVEMLRTALRQDAPRLRRHIHSTRDRLEELRRKLPPAERRGGDRPPRYQGGGPPRYQGAGPGPRGGERREGRPQGQGGGGPRQDRPPRQGGGGPRQDRPPREPREQRPVAPEQKFLVEGKMSLGEMILAKLKEKEAK